MLEPFEPVELVDFRLGAEAPVPHPLPLLAGHDVDRQVSRGFDQRIGVIALLDLDENPRLRRHD